MRVLVIGQGGREHAIIWALNKSEKVEKLYCAPGNAGIAQMAECVAIPEGAFQQLIDFSKENKVDFVVVGPEVPLFNGIVDAFEQAGIDVFGPNKAAAIIEGSKVFTKDLLQKYQIPTAAYASFEDYDGAVAYLHEQKVPIVIKADGLAAGKGVVVASTMEEAEQALQEMMVDNVFGEAGSQVVIEEFLQGQEMSILAFVDGNVVRPMVPSQDHKPAYDGDKGPNTGGMGTYSPVPHIPQSVVDEAIATILKPAAEAMVQEGRPFKGILYAGLMITADGPKTIEFNCRFGDPETQVVLPRLQTDLLDIFLATVHGELQNIDIQWSDQSAVCVIMASGGYPGKYEKGKEINGLNQLKDSMVFHAGTAWKDDKVVTNGGRVIGVTGMGDTLKEARNKAYADAEKIRFEGKHMRTDIAEKALQA